jgi:hypothetical protein
MSWLELFQFATANKYLVLGRINLIGKGCVPGNSPRGHSIESLDIEAFFDPALILDKGFPSCSLSFVTIGAKAMSSASRKDC